jgi:hypothetical protein
MTLPYRKKLIEVGLPLVAINAESAREKTIRHGQLEQRRRDPNRPRRDRALRSLAVMWNEACYHQQEGGSSEPRQAERIPRAHRAFDEDSADRIWARSSIAREPEFAFRGTE